MSPSQVQAMTRIQEGQNIFAINLNAESRRLEHDPWIYRAVVKRSLPSAIDIQIIERNPVAVIKQDDFYLVDDHGEIFKRAAEHERVYPLLAWADGDTDSAADGASVRIISAALSLIARLHECGLNPEAGTTIEMSRDRGLTLSQGADGARIYLGFDNFAEKLQQAALVLNDLSSKGLAAAAIHLGSGHKAYVRLHDAQEQHI
jgi:cell division protein FtsQ